MKISTTSNNGKVGIGTTSPGALLDVHAATPTGVTSVMAGTNLLIDSNTNSYLTFRQTADSGLYGGLIFTDNNHGSYIAFRNYVAGQADSDSLVYGTYNDHIFQTGTSGVVGAKTTVMTIKQAGNVGIGDTTPTEGTLTVAGTGYFTGAVTASSFIYSSDFTLKKNIQTIPNALEKIKQLEGVSFEWKDEEKGSGTNLGLIAQDVELIFPEIVFTNSGTGLKAVKYGNLVSPLIEAVKELDNKISEKNIRIKELEERLNRLEEMIGSGDVSDFNEGVLR